MRRNNSYYYTHHSRVRSSYIQYYVQYYPPLHVLPLKMPVSTVTPYTEHKAGNLIKNRKLIWCLQQTRLKKIRLLFILITWRLYDCYDGPRVATIQVWPSATATSNGSRCGIIIIGDYLISLSASAADLFCTGDVHLDNEPLRETVDSYSIATRSLY